MHKGAPRGIQRIAKQPSLVFCLIALLLAILAIMTSLDVAIEAHSDEHGKYLPHWFSSMNASILSSITTPFSNPSLLGFHPSYDWERSTEDNYRSDNQQYYGVFRSVRQRLDHSYHHNYTPARQAVQDTIIESLLHSTTVRDSETGQECSKPAEPWIIFTAGVYGKNPIMRENDQ